MEDRFMMIPILALVLLFLTACGSEGGNGNPRAAITSAETYYMSPTGADVPSGGTLNEPWLTFHYAVSRLWPGDTLILKNGTYTDANSGLLILTDKDGTADNPITIRAENEWQAHISSNGRAGLIIIRSD
jgi:hypothetical protein